MDDKVDHLEDVAPLGVRGVLAAWGYNGLREQRRAAGCGFPVCRLEDFEARVFGWQGGLRRGRYPHAMDPGFRFHAERTPNPDSIKWVLGEPVVAPGVTADFPEPVGPEVSPLAARLFGVSGVTRVFFTANFVTVTRRPEIEWTDLAQPLVDALKAFAGSGEPALGPAFVPPAAAAEGDVVTRIRRILEEEVRPAVAMDGGDVVFAGFRDGVVEVQLQGSCVGCPSSTATLRFGIEARLREAIPEVSRVVSV